MNMNVMGSFLVPASTEAAPPPWLAPRGSDLESLSRLTSGLVGLVGVREIADFVVNVLVQETAAENCSLMLLDENTELEIVAAVAEFGDPDADPVAGRARESFKIGEGVAGWVASQQVSVRLNEAAKDARFVSLEDSGVEVNSLMSFPLIAAGEMLGVLNLSHSATGVFSRQEEWLVSMVAEHIGSALGRARDSEQVRVQNDSLREQVTLYQTRLAQAEKMSAVGNLLAGIVHELNNPLTTILGFSQLLAQTGEGDQKNLERIVSESERCARIVQNVLRISRPGKAEQERLDLNQVVQQTVELAEYQLRLHRIGLRMDLSAASPFIVANSCEFTQVVLNLITNAIQAIAENRPHGKIDVDTKVADGRVSVHIRDDGPGIEESVLGRIFDPFFTTKQTGTGLGLNLSRELIQANHGDISVTSSVGGGTTFTLDFPLVDIHPDDEVSTGKLRVLVADDEHHILDLVDAVLSESDYAVECVPTGEAAMEKLEDRDYDLLISDLRMPGIGGRELVEWVRSEGKTSKILLLTGDVASREMKDFIASSGSQYLSKPFRIGELIDAVRAAFDAD